MQPITPHCSRVQLCRGQSEPADQAAGFPTLTSNPWTEAGLTNCSNGVIPYILHDSYALSIHKLQGNTSDRLMQEKGSLLPHSCLSAARGQIRSKDSNFSPSHVKKGGGGETKTDWASEHWRISQCRFGELRRVANSPSHSMSDEWRLISRYIYALHYYISSSKSLGGEFLS